MSRAKPKDLAASVRQRLLSLSHEAAEPFDLTLKRYAIERLLYRLDRSGDARQFVLKGAMLFNIWPKPFRRPTKDLDLLGPGGLNQKEIAEVFQRALRVGVEPDGLRFDPDPVGIEEIREDQEYVGQRIRLRCYLGLARISLQVDIGFGDRVVPEPQEIAYPTLLGFPAPHIKAYSPESVIAEKLHAMIVLGLNNSRMKDFYDLWMMSVHLSLSGPMLITAIRAVFDGRQTPFSDAEPMAFSGGMAHAPEKQVQWKAFLRRGGLISASFPEVISALRGFLGEPLAAAAWKLPFRKMWNDGGPWQDWGLQ